MSVIQYQTLKCRFSAGIQSIGTERAKRLFDKIKLKRRL